MGSVKKENPCFQTIHIGFGKDDYFQIKWLRNYD